MVHADITVIHKEDKDSKLCPSYCPIFLLNVDIKRFTKVFTLQLAPLLLNLIHVDKLVFVHSHNNMIKVLNTIHYAHTKKIPMCLLSTDAKKEYERVGWLLLFLGFRLSPMMYAWISVLYKAPTVSTRVSGVLSSPFQIRKLCSQTL